MPSVEIILPVHNGLSYVRDAVAALCAYTSRQLSQVRIVDDASDARTAAWLRAQAAEYGDWLHVERQDYNLGFLATCNRALTAPLPPTTEYVLLLNSDVLVAPNWLERLLACAESDPRIASVNPLTNCAANIDLPMSPGTSYLAMNAYLATQRAGHCHDVVTCVGFCLLLRRSALAQVGYFDPVYGHGYCEESDLCMRLVAAGWRTVVAEDVYVYHRGGGSFSDAQQRYLHNRRIFDQRWGAAYRAQFHAFRCADPLQTTRKLFTLSTRWTPQPAIWQAARALLAEWQGARSFQQLVRLALRHSLAVVRSREANPVRALNAQLTPPHRLRVTYVLDRLVVAGGVLSVLQLVNELIRLGVEARVVALYADPLVEEWRPLYTKPLIYRDLPTLLAECPDSDIIFATHWNTAPWVQQLWQAGRSRCAAYLIQDYEPWFFPESAVAQRQQVLDTYQMLPQRIVMSEWLQTRLAQDGYSSDKITLGMDLGQFYPRSALASQQQPIVLAMARPGTPRRGFPATVAALTLVKQQRPQVTIVLFGDRALRKQAIPFTFHDAGLVIRQEQLATLYAEADVFLDASEFQGFGRCALEAMAGATACVLTNVGGVNEYARHEENALLVAPGAVEQMAAAILRLLDDVPLRQRLVAQGLETAQRFCQRREARETLAWMERVLA